MVTAMHPASFRALVALALLSPCAPAADYFVNSITGNNASGDGSVASPWRTITFALSQVPGPGDTIHVAAGTYDLTLGEVYPIDMKPGVSVIGAGFGVPILD